MPGKAVRIQLASGVEHAVLPDGRKAVANESYNVSWEDFQKIAPAAREKLISIVSVESSTATAWNGTDLTVNSTTVPDGHYLGEVVEGTQEGDLYRLVKVVDANLAAGDVVTWASFDDLTVTKDRAGGSAISPLVYAGVALGTITAGRYGYIQVYGEVPSLKVPSSTVAGATLAISTTVDGSTTESYTEEVYNLTFTATGGTFTLTYDGTATSALAYDASAATIQTALRLLPGLEATEVTGTTTKVIIPNTGVVDIDNITIQTGSLTGGSATLTTFDGGDRVALFTTVAAEDSGTAAAFITDREGKAKRLWKHKRKWIV